MNVRPGFTFDDLLLIPKHSTVTSRKDVDISVNLGKGIRLRVPIASSNMPTITGPKMAKIVASFGGLAALHRFCSPQDQIDTLNFVIKENPEYINFVSCSVGVKKEDYNNIDKLAEYFKVVIIDVAHGDSDLCFDMTNYIAKKFPNMLLISGNVATFGGAYALWNCGANVVKAGIGSGSICTTRVETGNGVPMLTTLSDICYMAQKTPCDIKVIADGGVRNGGDLTKCLCFASMAMLGNVLAGTDESPGDILEINGQQYKEYRGSSTYSTTHIEGVAGLVPYKGSAKNVIDKLLQGLRSGCSYQGANTLEELRKDPQFVSITHAGLIESRPHDIILK